MAIEIKPGLATINGGDNVEIIKIDGLYYRLKDVKSLDLKETVCWRRPMLESIAEKIFGDKNRPLTLDYLVLMTVAFLKDKEATNVEINLLAEILQRFGLKFGTSDKSPEGDPTKFFLVGSKPEREEELHWLLAISRLKSKLKPVYVDKPESVRPWQQKRKGREDKKQPADLEEGRNISALRLWPKTRQCLEKAGIETIEDLIGLETEEFDAIADLKDKTKIALVEKILSHGLSFADGRERTKAYLERLKAKRQKSKYYQLRRRWGQTAKALEDKRISALRLYGKTTDYLRSIGIETVSDLTELTTIEFGQLNLHRRTKITIVKEKMLAHGLFFADGEKKTRAYLKRLKPKRRANSAKKANPLAPQPETARSN